jgi:hypothetical protein
MWICETFGSVSLYIHFTHTKHPNYLFHLQFGVEDMIDRWCVTLCMDQVKSALFRPK